MNDDLGSLRLFAGNFAPRGYLPCSGALLPIRVNIPLFTIIGTLYGGDGVNTFALPKMDPPLAGMIWVICTQGTFPNKAG